MMLYCVKLLLVGKRIGLLILLMGKKKLCWIALFLCYLVTIIIIRHLHYYAKILMTLALLFIYNAWILVTCGRIFHKFHKLLCYNKRNQIEMVSYNIIIDARNIMQKAS